MKKLKIPVFVGFNLDQLIFMKYFLTKIQAETAVKSKLNNGKNG